MGDIRIISAAPAGESMMFEAISRLFREKEAPADLTHEPRLAVAALLVHLAAVDGSASEAERKLRL